MNDEYPAIPTPKGFFDDRQFVKIDVITVSEPNEDKQYVKGKATIQTLTHTFTVDNIGVKLTGGTSITNNPHGYYFKAGEFAGSKDDFDGVEEFSIKKCLTDPYLLAEKLGSEIALALGYYPRHVAWADVTVNGIHLGLYAVMERMKNQWAKGVFGVDENGEQGSQYEAENANLGMGDPVWDVKFSNSKQNEKELDDINALATYIQNTSSNFDGTLAEHIDIDFFARAAVLGFFANDWDSYWKGNNHNYEWYHDVKGKWKLLLWDFDGSFQVAQSSDHFWSIGGNALVLNRLLALKDGSYKNKYNEIMCKFVKTVLPDTSANLYQRFEKYWEIIKVNDFEDGVTYDPQPAPPRGRPGGDGMSITKDWKILGRLATAATIAREQCKKLGKY